MINLRKEFRRKGVNFTQVYKSDGCVIYRLSDVDIWYEIFRYRVGKPDRFHNDEYERYPSDESFGSWAWCITTKSSLKKIVSREFPDEDLDVIMQLATSIP